MLDIDVTSLVALGDTDGECVALLKCVCGHKWPDWEEHLSISRSMPFTCPVCGRKLYVKMGVCTVYQILEP